MRTLRKNKRHMYYANLVGTTPQYVYDSDGNKVIDRVTSSGDVIYRKTGKKINQYSTPQGFFGNISMSGGEVVEKEYGIDVSGYDAVMICSYNEIDIKETSLIWYQKEPSYIDNDKTILDESSADYKVLTVKPSLNYTKYILGKLN